MTAGSIVGTFENGLPSGNAVRVMASGAKYSGGFIEGLYNGSGSALFFDGSLYEGGWESGLRCNQGRWVHEDASHVPPEVLGMVFEAVRGVIGGAGGGAHAIGAAADVGDDRDDAAETSASPSPPPPSAPAPPLLPPDILFAPVPGKMGGDGALDAGKGGNPSGAPPSQTHSLINTFLSPARISRRPRLRA